MSRTRSCILTLAGLLALQGCGRDQTSATQNEIAAARQGSIQEIMALNVDPNADQIWGAFKTVETASGSVTSEPKTAAEWKALEERARRLLDGAATLDRLPPAVPPGADVADAHIAGTRTVAQIEADIKADPAAFRARVAVFRAAAREILESAIKRDKAGTLEGSERLDASCDGCHFAYWHPRVPPTQMPGSEAFEQHRP